MEEKIIYVLTAHRTKSQHSYVVGLYENIHDAEEAAFIESTNRAMKYAMRVASYPLNKMPEDLTNNEHD